jgi:hypothetical protein
MIYSKMPAPIYWKSTCIDFCPVNAFGSQAAHQLRAIEQTPEIPILHNLAALNRTAFPKHPFSPLVLDFDNDLLLGGLRIGKAVLYVKGNLSSHWRTESVNPAFLQVSICRPPTGSLLSYVSGMRNLRSGGYKRSVSMPRGEPRQ